MTPSLKVQVSGSQLALTKSSLVSSFQPTPVPSIKARGRAGTSPLGAELTEPTAQQARATNNTQHVLENLMTRFSYVAAGERESAWGWHAFRLMPRSLESPARSIRPLAGGA